jgi:hypothetical protein
MRTTIVIAALLCVSPALAQTARPATINDSLITCLRIPDGTKGRLDCFDAAIASTPKSKPASSRDVASCRFYTEQDGRLACFNDFAESIPRYSSH